MLQQKVGYKHVGMLQQKGQYKKQVKNSCELKGQIFCSNIGYMYFFDVLILLQGIFIMYIYIWNII